MELRELTKNIQLAMKDKEAITQAILENNLELAEQEKDYRWNMAVDLLKLRGEKTPTVIINKIAEGNTRQAKYHIEVLEYKIKHLRDKLENIRQDIEVYRSLIRNERELSNLL